MTRMRRQCARLVPALAALFALALAAPRPGLVRHAHDGGEHVHTHARPAAGGAARDHAERPPRDGFTRSGAADATHAHAQHPFDFAVAPALASVTICLAVAPLAPAGPRPPGERAGTAAHARGPPAALPA